MGFYQAEKGRKIIFSPSQHTCIFPKFRKINLYNFNNCVSIMAHLLLRPYHRRNYNFQLLTCYMSHLVK